MTDRVREAGLRVDGQSAWPDYSRLQNTLGLDKQRSLLDTFYLQRSEYSWLQSMISSLLFPFVTKA